MFETLVALDVTRRMRAQFEMDDTIATRPRRSREHRPPRRATSTPTARVLARLKPSRVESR